MTQTTHTPGPWKLCTHMAGTDPDCPCGFYGNVWSDDEETVVAFMGACTPHKDEFCACNTAVVHDLATRQANARLIAAAPDLLERLKDLVADHVCPSAVGHSLADCRWCAARDAIAQAEVETR